MRTLYEDDLTPGKKHHGKSIAEVAAVDPRYLEELQAKSRTFCISDEVMDNLDMYRQRKTGQMSTGAPAQEEDTD
jgi:hypothetical protein